MQMRKRAQGFLYDPNTSGKTIRDLIRAIRADAGLPDNQKMNLVQQIDMASAGMPSDTPLSALLYKGLGGTLGWLISKYFGMGAVGQLTSTLLGVGLGSMMSRPSTVWSPR